MSLVRRGGAKVCTIERCLRVTAYRLTLPDVPPASG